MNPELTNFIEAQLQQGQSKEQISQTLLGRGWPKDIIEQALVQTESPTFMPPGSIPNNRLLGPIEMMEQAFSVIKHHLGSILFLSIIPGIISILVTVGIVVLVLVGIFGSLHPGAGFNPTLIIGGIIAFVLLVIGIVIINIWFQTAMYLVIVESNATTSIKQILKKSFSKILSFGLAMFLYSFMMTGGFLLFIIPGIYFMVCFILTPYIVLAENRRGMDALLASREYIRGYGKSVLWRVLFASLLALGFIIATQILAHGISNQGVRQIVLYIINLFMTPFFIAYSFVLYENLRAIKGPVQTTFTTGRKLIYIGIALLGVIIMLAGIFFSLKALLPTLMKLQQSRSSSFKFATPPSVTPIDTMEYPPVKVAP